MDPASAIPLHFSLEFVAVAAFGGLLAWAVHGRAWLSAAGASLLCVSQVVHTGQFVAGEDATAVVVLRLAGFVVLAAGLRLSRPAAEGEAAAAAATGTIPLSFATAAAAAAVAAGHRALADRRLWGAGWAGIAGAELWFAAAGTGATLLADDLGPHLLRAAGAALVAVWAWRRTAISLSLRLVAAFALVLFVVIVVAGSTVARVTSQTRADERLGRFAAQVQGQVGSLNVANQDVLGQVGDVAGSAFAPVLRANGDPNPVAQRLLDSGFLTNVDFVAVVRDDRGLVGVAGLQAAERVPVTGSQAVSEALRGSVVPSLERLASGIVYLGAAPVYGAGAPTPQNVIGAVVLGRRIGAASMEEAAASTGSEAALVAASGEVLASSTADLLRAELPAEALQDADEPWTGRFDAGEAGYLGATEQLQRPDGSSPASMLIAAPDTVLAQAAIDTSQALFAAVLAAALLAVIVALWLSSRIVRPVLDLTSTARLVEEGDLEASSDVRTSDEIGTLARAFDSMTGALRTTLASERDTRERMETIVSGMGEALIAVDADFTIVSFNPAAEELTGIQASEAVGKVCHEVYGHLTRRGIGGPICDSICPLRHDGGTDGAVQFTPPGSQPRTLAVTCSTLRDEDGNVVGGVDLLRDVTAQAEAERTKEAVIRHVSHELRTPLTSISSGAMLLLRKGDNLSAAQREGILEGIVSGSKKLERIAQILTDMAAFEAGQMHITLRPVRAGDLVGEVVAQWRTRAPDRDVRAVGARLAAAVEADRELIVRALDELVDNAIKFSPSGGPVTVRAGAADGGVEYSVQDRGIGLDPSRVDYLLQEFTQADLSEVRTAGGLGVGLPYVRRILEGHGTDLRVQSRPGKGATFSFVLRRATEAKGKRAAKRPARRRKARR